VPSNTDPSRSAEPDVAGVPASAIGPGSVVDARYRLEALVGRGGTATVYRGTDELLGRAVAVKVFNQHLTDPVTLTRQHQEMRFVAGLQHPHLVAVYDARVTDPEAVAAEIGLGYLVLEYVDGPSLAERLQQGGMRPAEVANVGAAIASALNLVHGAGLVHRDIKPGNILLTSTGQPKLSDFGIARALHAERITTSADVLGTAPYLSPEQARGGEVGPASDIYALGLVLLECLTGRREYPGPAIEAAVARLLRDPVIPTTLPAPWPGLLQSMTAPNPEARPTAAVVAATLAGDHSQVGTDLAGYRRTPDGDRDSATPATIVDARQRTPPTLAEPVREPRRRPIGALILAGVVGLLAVAAALIALTTGTEGRPDPTSPTPESGTAISTPAPTPPSATPAGQPAVVVTAQSAVPTPSPATSRPNTQTPNTQTPNTVGTDNGNNGNGRGNGNNGNGNNGNGNGNGGNGNSGNGNGNRGAGNGNGNGGAGSDG
jgi:serine/threonine protein kinase